MIENSNKIDYFWFEANELKQHKQHKYTKFISKAKFMLVLVLMLLFTCAPPAPVTLVLPSLTKQELQHQIKQYNCIKEVLYYEARGEPQQGIHAVLSVVHNRALHQDSEGDYCKIIREPKQFSYRNAVPVFKQLKTGFSATEAQKATYVSDLAYRAATGGFKPSLPSSVLWYHSSKVNPSWNKQMKTYATIGHHKFLGAN